MSRAVWRREAPDSAGWWDYRNSAGQVMACKIVDMGGDLYVENADKMFPVAQIYGEWRQRAKQK